MKQSDPNTPFNMAMLYYVRLNSLLDKKDSKAIDGDVWSWYNYLRAVYRNIFFKIDENKRKDLDDLFKRVRSTLSVEKVNNSSVYDRVMGLAVSRAGRLLDQIDCEIILILDQKNMIFPNLKIEGGLAEVRKQFGLDQNENK